MNTNKRILYFDILNILACFCVIWLHCNGIVHAYGNYRAWYTSLIVEVIAYWAVPIFFMLSGATLMNYRKKYDTKTFLKKRFFRVVIPFIFWAIFVFILKVSTGRMIIEDWSVTNLINIFLNNGEEIIYWFFFPLFAVYIAMPFLSLLTESKYRKYLWYAVLIFFLTASFIEPICRMFNINWNVALNFPLLSGYTFYVVLGYLLSTENIDKKKRILIYILGILAVFFRYFVVYTLSIRDGATNRLFFNYIYFPSVLLALAVFVFFKYANFVKAFKSIKKQNVLAKISSCSFGIYLIHQIVMYYEIKIFNINISCFEWRTIGAISTYIICLLIVLILKKIPIVNKIVP